MVDAVDGVVTISVRDSFLNACFGSFPEKKQCDTKAPSGRCPDEAFYTVHRDDRPSVNVCSRCVTAAIFYGTNRGKAVTIVRVDNGN